jgi:hypothetical protein
MPTNKHPFFLIPYGAPSLFSTTAVRQEKKNLNKLTINYDRHVVAARWWHEGGKVALLTASASNSECERATILVYHCGSPKQSWRSKGKSKTTCEGVLSFARDAHLPAEGDSGLHFYRP